MNRVRPLVLAVIGLATVSTVAARCATKPDNSNVFYSSALGSEVWKGDNQNYAEARQQIEKEISSGQAPDALVAHYQSLVKLDPSNPLTLFRWAYASRKAALASNPFAEKRVLEALEAMNRDSKPHPYDYVRLHFLLASDVWPSITLRPLGQRLLQYNPDDRSVLYEMVVDMKNSMSLDDRKEAVSLAEKMVQKNPKNPADHVLLAGTYDNLWGLTRQRSIADKAIAEYQIYLQLAPANDNFRRGAEQMLTAMKNNR